jgi:hypothetical protein
MRSKSVELDLDAMWHRATEPRFCSLQGDIERVEKESAKLFPSQALTYQGSLRKSWPTKKPPNAEPSGNRTLMLPSPW